MFIYFTYFLAYVQAWASAEVGCGPPGFSRMIPPMCFST